MQAVSRLGAGGRRIFRYCCASYWNRGVAVCSNGRQVDMGMADRAVHDLLRTDLKPRIFERALDLALDVRAGDRGPRRSGRVCDRGALRKQLRGFLDDWSGLLTANLPEHGRCSTSFWQATESVFDRL